MRRLAYIALDHGARLTLGALAARLPGAWVEAEPSQWKRTLEAEGIGLLVCGTSDSVRGRATERAARLAAARLELPLVVVEDFPGNFDAIAQASPQLLCVESEFAARLARRKSGKDALPVHVGPAIRYDALRRRLSELRAHRESSDAVLWIGQPETSESLATLRLILPELRATNIRVWLRAHPRDEGYACGAYTELRDRGSPAVDDVTAWSLEECLRRRPRLIVTQFSSVAVEAGFWGIPALHVLLPDAGGKRLAETKGYAIPPWCTAGAAFCVTSCAEVKDVLSAALDDERPRRLALERFDDYFMVGVEGVPRLVNVLYNQGFLQ